MHGQKAGPRMRWTASHLVPVVNGLSRYKKLLERSCKTQSGNEASQLLVLALVFSLASKTQPTPARIGYRKRSALALVGSPAWKITLLVCFCTSLASFHTVHAGHGLFVRQVCTAFMPFGLLVNLSTRFQAIRPAFKPFGPVSKRDHFALCIESGPTSLKTG